LTTWPTCVQSDVNVQTWSVWLPDSFQKLNIVVKLTYRLIWQTR